MTTNYAQQVQQMLVSMSFDNYKKPTAEQMTEILSSGRSRILKASESDQLCPLSVEFFPFCWSVIGRFGATSYNAVEIGSLCRIQPIYIACAVHEFGVDWAHRLFALKRLVGVDRGENTIMAGASWFWSARELRRRCVPRSPDHTPRQKKLMAILRGESIADMTLTVEFQGSLVISVLGTHRQSVFIDKRKKDPQGKKGNAMTVVSESERQRKAERQHFHELAVHPYPVDKTRPRKGGVRRISGGHCVYQLPN